MRSKVYRINALSLISALDDMVKKHTEVVKHIDDVSAMALELAIDDIECLVQAVQLLHT